MTLVDWCLLAAVVLSIVIGIFRGFTREIMGLATWVAAIVAALILAPHAAGWLESRIAAPSVRIATAYAMVFFVGLLAGSIITSIVSAIVRKSPLSPVDRTVGAGFGLLRGVLVAVIFVWLVGLTPARQDPWWGQSVFIGKLEWLAQGLREMMPGDWKARLKPPTETSA